MARLVALALLAFHLVKTLVLRLLLRQDPVTRFRVHYDPDGLPPVSAAERAELPTFGGCLACGLCDVGEAERIRASGGAYRGVMPLMLAAARSMPDFRAAAYGFSFVPLEVLRAKEKKCPGQVPMAAIAAFVGAKAAALGGPLSVPAPADKPRASEAPTQ